MAFADVINDYTQGHSGVLIDSHGQSVTYTVTNGARTINQVHHGNHSAQIQSLGQDTVVVTFDQPIIGAVFAIYGSDSDESYSVIVDGVQVDLNVLIANGDATFSNVGTVATHTINPDGSISGGAHTDGSIGNVLFNIPITSLGATGTGGDVSEFQADGIEIGIDQLIFDVVCFTKGTLISTQTRQIQVEDLRIGDLIRTIDNQYKPIRWIGSRIFHSPVLRQQEHLRPVRITAGSLGNGLPEKDLCVSRQHRILVSSKVVENMFGVRDVLVPAIRLTALPGVHIDNDLSDVEYFHILLDKHEVIFAQGTAAESLFLGQQGLKTMSPKAKQEILSIFPGITDPDHVANSVRPIPTGRRQKQLIKRHAKNKKPLVESALN
ncbi:MAG: Hint domain-containing protein [Roseobacter sp.]